MLLHLLIFCLLLFWSLFYILFWSWIDHWILLIENRKRKWDGNYWYSIVTVSIHFVIHEMKHQQSNFFIISSFYNNQLLIQDNFHLFTCRFLSWWLWNTKKFLSASFRSSIVHHLSGPNMFTITIKSKYC